MWLGINRADWIKFAVALITFVSTVAWGAAEAVSAIRANTAAVQQLNDTLGDVRSYIERVDIQTARKLDEQGSRISDHEARLRVLER